ncbi:MAG: hypothetical protein K2N78_07700 [Oscillospiraceae bacterium]|nr:hypothetical protein [Oscillospiraceae bacterium]
MSKESERLFAAMNDVNDKAVDEAAQAMERKSRRWIRWAGLAAALLLVTGAGLLFLLPWGGGGAGGAGSSGSSTFMSYAGPVIPLTLREANPAITAERDIILDFQPWVPVWISNEEEAAGREGTDEVRQKVLDNYNEWYPEGGRYQYSSDILVTDAYTLTNTSGQDQTVTLLYPYAGQLAASHPAQPTLTLDGRELETVLHAGNYTGGYEGAWGRNGAEEGTVNLDRPDNWEDYRDALSGGDYLKRALSGYPDLSGLPVIIYEFTDPWGPPESDEVPNPSLRVYFDLDFDRTTVLTTGFHAMSWDMEAGTMMWGFSIPQPGERIPSEPYSLIVLGDDIRDMKLQGCVTGGFDDDPIVEAGATVRRYESDLETALRAYAEIRYGSGEWENGVDFHMYFGLMKDQLIHYGLLSDEPMEMYTTGFLDDLNFASVDRVFYLETEVTIPAGEIVTLTVEMTKDGSYDFYCAHTENRGIYGYDLVTKLGSDLTCTRQGAQLEDHGQIEIVRENFGFDLEKNIRTVELDLAEDHYYLEVRRIEEP